MAKRKATKPQRQKQLRDEEEIRRSSEGLLFNQNAGVGFSEKVDCHFDGMAWNEGVRWQKSQREEREKERERERNRYRGSSQQSI